MVFTIRWFSNREEVFEFFLINIISAAILSITLQIHLIILRKNHFIGLFLFLWSNFVI